jgi:hypothetical protein
MLEHVSACPHKVSRFSLVIDAQSYVRICTMQIVTVHSEGVKKKTLRLDSICATTATETFQLIKQAYGDNCLSYLGC